MGQHTIETTQEFVRMMQKMDADFKQCCSDMESGGSSTGELRRELWKENRWLPLEEKGKELYLTLDEEEKAEYAAHLQELKTEYLCADQEIKRTVIAQELQMLKKQTGTIGEKLTRLDDMARAYRSTGYTDAAAVLEPVESMRAMLRRTLAEKVFPAEALPVNEESLQLIDMVLKSLSLEEKRREELVSRRRVIIERLEQIKLFQQEAEAERIAAQRANTIEIGWGMLERTRDFLQQGRAFQVSVIDHTHMQQVFGLEVILWNNFLVDGEHIFEECLRNPKEWLQIDKNEDLIRRKYQYRQDCLQAEVPCYEADMEQAIRLWSRCEERVKEKRKEMSVDGLLEGRNVGKLLKQPKALFGFMKELAGKSVELVVNTPQDSGISCLKFSIDRESGRLCMEGEETL